MDGAIAGVANTLAEAYALVVLCDFDDALGDVEQHPTGTLSGTLEALQHLGSMVRTVAAMVSERPLEDLREICESGRSGGVEPAIELFGSRGTTARSAEAALGLTNQARRSRWLVQQAARWIAGEYPGAAIEDRPFGVAMHVTALSPLAAQQALDQLVRVTQALPTAARVQRRNATVSVSVLPPGQDSLIEALRQRSNATILYIGNDISAHAALDPTDTGCTVGRPLIPGAVPLRTVHDATAFVQLVARIRATGAGTAISALE